MLSTEHRKRITSRESQRRRRLALKNIRRGYDSDDYSPQNETIQRDNIITDPTDTTENDDDVFATNGDEELLMDYDTSEDDSEY